MSASAPRSRTRPQRSEAEHGRAPQIAFATRRTAEHGRPRHRSVPAFDYVRARRCRPRLHAERGIHCGLCAQRIRTRRHRRHCDGANQAYRVRPGAIHWACHTSGRGDGRGLVPGAGRARAFKRRPLQESSVWGPGYWRLDRHCQFLRADAPRGRRGACYAGPRGRRCMAGAGGRDHGGNAACCVIRPGVRAGLANSPKRRRACRFRPTRSSRTRRRSG